MVAPATSFEAPPDSEGIQKREALGFPTPGQLFALFLGYFCLQVLIRTLLSSSVDLDEAEQMMWTQKFSWGYGTAPPVYTWIQMGFFAVLGRTVFALALWKNLVLLATYGFVYASARLVTRSHRCGAAAALSLLFMPHMVWEAQRDLTHTVLACACAGATLFSLLRVHETKSVRGYAALGVAVGMGLLSKFNFGLWVVGLGVAALSMREYRATVLRSGMLLALTLAALMVLPNWLWCLNHRELALQTSSKLGVAGAHEWLGAVWLGLRHIGQALLAFIGVPVGFWLVVCLSVPKSWPQPSVAPPATKLLGRAFLFILGLLVFLVVAFRANGFRERWLQPLLVCAPVLAVAWLREQLNAERLRWLTLLGLGVMAVIALCIPGRIIFIERLKREEPLSRPYAELARQMASALPKDTLLVSDTIVLGGNLQLALPEQRAATPALAKMLGEERAHCAIVWDANLRDLPPKALAAWAQQAGSKGRAPAPPQYYTATYKFHHTRQFRVGLMLLY